MQSEAQGRWDEAWGGSAEHHVGIAVRVPRTNC